jgi:hypothetical protein
MPTLTLRFSRPQAGGDVYDVTLEHPLCGEVSGAFARPFDDATWAAVSLALDPAFDLDDPFQFSADQRAALAARLEPLHPLLETVGGALLDALLADEHIGSPWHAALGADADACLPVELRLGAGAEPLAALPWETLYDARARRFLVRDGAIALSRYLAAAAPPGEPLAALPLRVLLVLAEPAGVSPVFPIEEHRALNDGLRSLDQEGAVVVDRLRPPTFEALVQAVTVGGYHVVHFHGHGVYDPADGGGRPPRPPPPRGPPQHKTGVRLAFLSACQSAQSDVRPTATPSLTATLNAAGVPLAVGMQTSVTVAAAVAFARQFYLSLAAGKPAIEAVADARKPLLTAQHRGAWAAPALYGRLRGETGQARLFDLARLGDELAAVAGLRAELQRRRVELAALEAEAPRLGAAHEPGEMARLRAARAAVQATHDALARQTAGRRFAPAASLLYSVPGNPYFVGRADELQAVAHGFKERQRTVVWGTGGIGKTALAIEAVRRQNWRFPGGVLWLGCRGGPAFDTLLNRIGAFCGADLSQTPPPERPGRARALLAGLDGDSLLVWDNFEDVEETPGVTELLDRLPPNCKTLHTTRPRPEDDRAWKVQTGPLSGDEMWAIFQMRRRGEGLRIALRDLRLLGEMLDFLEGHPLALRWLVPLLLDAPVAEVWDELRREGLEPVRAAFETSFAALDAPLQGLFARLSVFSIPFEAAAAEALAGRRRDLRELRRRALVDFDGQRYDYHQLVRQYANDKLRAGGGWAAACRAAAAYLQEKAQAGVTPDEALEECDLWQRAGEWAAFARRSSDLVGSLDRHGYWPQIAQRLEGALSA